MGILKTLKSLLGMDSSGRSRRRAEPDVTVEHEPSTSAERAVKTDTGVDPETAETGEHTSDATSTDAPSANEQSSQAEADESAPVEEITGIGPTYAERLEAAGIATVADLADSDVSTIVEAAQATESRAQDWLDQARDR